MVCLESSILLKTGRKARLASSKMVTGNKEAMNRKYGAPRKLSCLGRQHFKSVRIKEVFKNMVISVTRGYDQEDTEAEKMWFISKQS